MNEKIVEVLITNAPLVFSLGVLYCWATPKLIKYTLKNGGGEIVKGIVRAANAEQSKEHFATFAALDKRLAVVESRLELP